MIFREDISILFIRFTRLRLDVDSQPFQRNKEYRSIDYSFEDDRSTNDFVRARDALQKEREREKKR